MMLVTPSRFFISAIACLFVYSACVQPALGAPKKAAKSAAAPIDPVVQLLCPAGDAKAEDAKKRAKLLKMLQDIARGGDINATDKNGQTALMYAAALGERLAVYWLVAKGADVTLESKKGKTALSFLPQDSPLLPLLVVCADEVKSDVNWYTYLNCSEYPKEVLVLEDLLKLTDKSKQEATMDTCDTEALAILVRHGYDVNHNPEKSRTLIGNSPADKLRLLLALGLQADKSDPASLLRIALIQNDVKALRTILAANPELAKTGRPLAKSCSVEAAKLLLKAGADIGDKELLRHLECRNASLVKYMLAAGAYTGQNDEGGNALHYGVWSAKCVDLLVKAGVAVNAGLTADGMTPLHNAAAHCDEEMVKALLAHGAKTDATCKKKDRALTPLEYAMEPVCMRRKLPTGLGSTVAALLKGGAAPKINDEGVETSPLYKLLTMNHDGARNRRLPEKGSGDHLYREIMDLLQGIDKVEPDALLYMSRNTLAPEQWAKVGHTLLDKGANPLASDAQGNTTLTNGGFWDRSLAERLIAAGVDVTVGNQGKALIQAARYRRCDVMELLFAKGLKVDEATMDDAICQLIAYSCNGDEQEPYETCMQMAKVLKDNGANFAKSLLINYNMIKPAVKAIVTLGIDNPQMRGFDDMTLLMQGWAVDYVPELIALGLDVNAQDNWGNTTISYIIRNTKGMPKEQVVNIVKALLAAGADMKKRGRGKTAFDSARQEKNLQFIECLEQCGVKE